MTKHDPDRAARILETIELFTEDYGHPPSIRDISLRVGLVPSAVHGHIARLLRDGLVVRCRCGCGRVRVAP